MRLTNDSRAASGLTRRGVVAGLLAAPLILPAPAVLGALKAESFGLAADGVADDAANLARAIMEAGRSGRPLALAKADYAIGSRGFEVQGAGAVSIECEDGARIVDGGREIEAADGGTRRVPWGFAFRECGSVRWRGGTIVTEGGGLGGSSSGLFTHGRAGERRPVAGFDRCRSLQIVGLTLDGNPGAGVSLEDRSAWGDADGPHDDPYIALSNAFLRATRCDDVRIENGALAPERCRREMWTLVDCAKVVIKGLVSRSTSNNFSSLAKVIRCGDVDISGIRVSDPGRGSLVDVIATKFRYADVEADYPNGKLLDVSQEWREFNAPIVSGVIENCRTTGVGVVSVGGKSAKEDIARGEIGSIALRGVTAFGGDGRGAKAPVLFLIPRARKVDVRDCALKNMAPTLPRRGGPASEISIADCTLDWDGNAAPRARAMTAAGVWTWTRTTFRGASPASPTEVAFRNMPGGAGRHAFVDCRFENLRLKLDAPATFERCAFVNAERDGG